MSLRRVSQKPLRAQDAHTNSRSRQPAGGQPGLRAAAPQAHLPQPTGHSPYSRCSPHSSSCDSAFQPRSVALRCMSACPCCVCIRPSAWPISWAATCTRSVSHTPADPSRSAPRAPAGPPPSTRWPCTWLSAASGLPQQGHGQIRMFQAAEAVSSAPRNAGPALSLAARGRGQGAGAGGSPGGRGGELQGSWNPGLWPPHHLSLLACRALSPPTGSLGRPGEVSPFFQL